NDRARLHSVVDQVRRRVRRVDNVVIVGDADDRRRQIDIEAADRAGIAIGIVDDDDLAAVAIPADPAHQLTIGTHYRDDLATVRAHHDGAIVAADALGPDIARAIAEAIELVVPNKFLTAGIADDDPSGFRDHGAAAFLDLVALTAEVIQSLRTLRRC